MSSHPSAIRSILLCLGLGLAATAASPAAPKVEDSIARRAQACTVCHGRDGQASSAGYLPRIAGKPAGYLFNQLLNFRDGRRHYALMVSLIDPLSDDYLREIAGYFGALDLPYPPPQPPNVSPDVLARGQQLVKSGDAARRIPACSQCHGTALTGMAPAIPGLLGVPRDYLNAQLGAWQTGKRRALAPDCMAQVAKLLTTDDIGALSQWLASQPVPEHAKPAPASADVLPIACGGVAGSNATAAGVR